MAAALVAAGVACAMFGVVVVVAEASAGAKDLLTFYELAGSLSGKATVATLMWLGTWLALHFGLRGSHVDLRACLRVTFALVGLGFVTTFPPIFQLFGH